MKLTARYLILLIAALSLRARAQRITGDVMALKPTAMPLTCNNGDLRIDSADLYKLKMCRLNSWVYIIEATAAVTNPLNATLAINGALSVTGYGVFSQNVTASGFVGTLTGNVTGAVTGRADSAGTASFATAATTAVTATSAGFSSTASTAGTAAFTPLASAATAFTTTPSACSANQYAQFIAPNGNLTCAQVSFSQLTGTASVSQAGVPPGTLIMFAGTTCPSTYLTADGTTVSRTTFSALFSAIGTTYGTGDGTSTFNLPNGKGVFIRGAGSQTISAITYSAAAQGTSQGDLFQGHAHQFNRTVSGQSGGAVGVADGASVISTGGPVTDGVNGSPRSGNETRPANIVLLFCVKSFLFIFRRRRRGARNGL